MAITTVAILSPGDMGHAVGRLLRERGLRVVTCLAGRSARTRGLSEKAGIIDVPTLEEMVAESDVILSITVSEVVPDLCRRVARAVQTTSSHPLFGQCNAISPQTARQVEPILTEAGARFVDASIIGGPPRGDRGPRFYASGPHAPELEGLRAYGLDVRNIGPEIGQASGIKMCYAALTKGSHALHTQLMVAAEVLGLSEQLRAEFQHSQPQSYQWMEQNLPRMPSKARRWVSEMQQIGATFGHLGLTPDLFKGVEEMYRFIGATPLGDEAPVTRDLDRGLEETVRELAAYVDPHPSPSPTGRGVTGGPGEG